MSDNYYAILGVAQNATREQIRARFLALARERHPDRFQSDAKKEAEVQFQAITEAFNVLSNPDRRRLHDQELAKPKAGEGTQADRKQVARVYLTRGVKAYRDKNYLEAADNFDRATREDPDNAQAWHHLARACSHQRRWLSRAGKAITKACELEPMNAEYHQIAGKIFADAGMTSRAVQYYKQAVRWGADDPSLKERIAELEGKKRRSGLFGRGGE
jgi:curved DNA-binding protein CbpA